MKTITGFFIIILIVGSLVGCSKDVKDNGDQTVTVNETTLEEAEVNRNYVSIPFKEHLYSKHSSSFTWEWSNTENIQKEITNKYEEFKNSVPGGFIVKETPTEYFICVSIGEQESVTKGFEIKSLKVQDGNEVGDPILKIEVRHVRDENPSDKEMQGKVFVRSLISVSKEDLPDGISIHSIIME